jgi:hypothetical protein
MTRLGLFILAVVIASSGSGNNLRIEPLAAAEGNTNVSYAKDVQPILAANCYNCHNAMKKKAGVDLKSSFAGVARIVKPENPDGSKLFKCLTGNGAKLMPPKRPLPEDSIAKIKSWIAAGAKEK